jgi:hypothetical protein
MEEQIKQKFYNIKQDHILKAFEEIDKNDIPPRRKSKTEDVLDLNKCKRYPPKYVIYLAFKYANNEKLDTKLIIYKYTSNKVLRELGFSVVSKN